MRVSFSLLSVTLKRTEIDLIIKSKNKNRNRCTPEKRFLLSLSLLFYIHFNVHLSLSIISLLRSSYCTLRNFCEPIIPNIRHFSHRSIAWKQTSNDLFEISQASKASMIIRFRCLFTPFNFEFSITSFCLFNVEKQRHILHTVKYSISPSETIYFTHFSNS